MFQAKFSPRATTRSPRIIHVATFHVASKSRDFATCPPTPRPTTQLYLLLPPSLFLRLSFSLLAGDVITIPGGWEARGWKEDGKHVFLLIALVGGTANNPINIRCGTSEFRGDEITEIKTAGAGGELNFSFATLRFPISLSLFLSF